MVTDPAQAASLLLEVSLGLLPGPAWAAPWRSQPTALGCAPPSTVVALPPGASRDRIRPRLLHRDLPPHGHFERRLMQGLDQYTVLTAYEFDGLLGGERIGPLFWDAQPSFSIYSGDDRHCLFRP